MTSSKFATHPASVPSGVVVFRGGTLWGKLQWIEQLEACNSCRDFRLKATVTISTTINTTTTTSGAQGTTMSTGSAMGLSGPLRGLTRLRRSPLALLPFAIRASHLWGSPTGGRARGITTSTTVTSTRPACHATFRGPGHLRSDPADVYTPGDDVCRPGDAHLPGEYTPEPSHGLHRFSDWTLEREMDGEWGRSFLPGPRPGPEWHCGHCGNSVGKYRVGRSEWCQDFPRTRAPAVRYPGDVCRPGDASAWGIHA